MCFKKTRIQNSLVNISGKKKKKKLLLIKENGYTLDILLLLLKGQSGRRGFDEQTVHNKIPDNSALNVKKFKNLENSLNLKKKR